MADDRFLGTWRLLAWENRDATGEISHPLGLDAIGLLTYTADGYMFAEFMAANRPRLSTDNVFGGDTEEVAAAARPHGSYCGTYEVFEDRVIHRVEASSFPNWVGGEQLRFYRFEHGQLILSAPPFKTRKGELTSHLIWERAQR